MNRVRSVDTYESNNVQGSHEEDTGHLRGVRTCHVISYRYELWSSVYLRLDLVQVKIALGHLINGHY